LRQIGHFIDCIDALLVKPFRDLTGAISGLGHLAKLLLKLTHQERFDLGFAGVSHTQIYWVPRLASNIPLVRFAPMISRFAWYAVVLCAMTILIPACASHDEATIEESSSQSVGTVPGEKVPDQGTFSPGPAGSSGSVHW